MEPINIILGLIYLLIVGWAIGNAIVGIMKLSEYYNDKKVIKKAKRERRTKYR